MTVRLALLAAVSATVFASPAAAAKKDWSALPVTPLEIGAGVSASLDSADLDDKDLWRDWYFVSAEAGETLTFTIEGGGEEPHLWLYRAQGRDEPISLQGALLASGWKRQFSYPVRESGQYLLSVASRYKPGGAYRVLAVSDKRQAVAAAPQPSNPVPVTTASVQRVEIDPARWTLSKPVYVHPGELVAGEISPVDVISGVERSGDVLTLQARAGEVITAQVRSDIPSLLVAFRPARATLRLSALMEGPARDAPLRFVAPKDDTYQIFVHSQGPERYGKYLLSIGADQGAPPLDPPKAAPPPVQVAEAPKSPPQPQAPSPEAAPHPKPAAPTALPKLIPPPGVMAADIGKPIARPAGKPGMKLDLYAFIGEAGSVVEANAVGGGGYGVTLYTPEGAEMLTQSGLGAAKLTAVLPQDAVYLLAVARQDAAKPYELSLAAQQPDIFQWAFRQGAGYEITDDAGKLLRRSCWVAPGQTLRLLYANGGTSDVTLQAGGAGRVETKGGSNTFTTRFEGGQFTRNFAQGTPATWSIDRPPPRLGAYRGYLCD